MPELQGCYYTAMLIEALQNKISRLEDKAKQTPDLQKEIQRLQSDRVAQEERGSAVMRLARQIIRELTCEDKL